MAHPNVVLFDVRVGPLTLAVCSHRVGRTLLSAAVDVDFLVGSTDSGMLPVSTDPPPPLIFWNHGVRARLPSKSLRNKDLCVKYSGIKT